MSLRALPVTYFQEHNPLIKADFGLQGQGKAKGNYDLEFVSTNIGRQNEWSL